MIRLWWRFVPGLFLVDVLSDAVLLLLRWGLASAPLRPVFCVRCYTKTYPRFYPLWFQSVCVCVCVCVCVRTVWVGVAGWLGGRVCGWVFHGLQDVVTSGRVR